MREAAAFSKVLIIAFCVAVALTVASTAYRSLAAFSGELCIGVGSQERVVVRTATGSRFPLAMCGMRVWRSVAPEEIPFTNPGAAGSLLDGEQRYDAVRLPFSVQVIRARLLEESDASDRLEILLPEGTSMVDIAPGVEVRVQGEPCTVREIRRWTGLLRDRRGQTMAAISLRQPDEAWTENIFLTNGTWRRVDPDLGMFFARVPEMETAKGLADSGLPGLDAARWGAVDGEAVHWLNAFSPGTAMQLRGGGSVTLLRVDLEHPTPTGPQAAIEVEVDDAGQKRTLWVSANNTKADPVVRFEYLSNRPFVVTVTSWADDTAIVAAFANGRAVGVRQMLAGESWIPQGFPYEFRLDQAIETALPVTSQESQIYEAVLERNGQIIRCRQGEAVRIGDALVQYGRDTAPPWIRYDIQVLDDTDGMRYEYRLEPDQPFVHKGWQFLSGPPGNDPLHTAVIRAER